MPTDRDLSVGQVAARSGMSVSALHFYERQGLLRSRRTSGNQRRYDRSVLRRVAVIRAAAKVDQPGFEGCAKQHVVSRRATNDGLDIVDHHAVRPDGGRVRRRLPRPAPW